LERLRVCACVDIYISDGGQTGQKQSKCERPHYTTVEKCRIVTCIYMKDVVCIDIVWCI